MVVVCFVCEQSIIDQDCVHALDNYYHSSCFICQYCLEPFPNNNFYEKENKLFCQLDYLMLFGHRCADCGELIENKCIQALNLTWHEQHFNCQECSANLVGNPYFEKYLDIHTYHNPSQTQYTERDMKLVPVCKVCHDKLKFSEITNSAKDVCKKCQSPIKDSSQKVIFEGSSYHSYHFECVVCHVSFQASQILHSSVTASTSTVNTATVGTTETPNSSPANQPGWVDFENKLYCLKDYQRVVKKQLPVCFVCFQPIVGRSVSALRKHFHPEHFACFQCDQRFLSSSYWELENKAYCEYHYNELLNASSSKHDKQLSLPALSVEKLNLEPTFHLTDAGTSLKSMGNQDEEGKSSQSKIFKSKSNLLLNAVNSDVDGDRKELVCSVCYRSIRELSALHNPGPSVMMTTTTQNKSGSNLCPELKSRTSQSASSNTLKSTSLIKRLNGKIYCELHYRCSSCHRSLLNQKVKVGHYDSKLLCSDCWHVLPSSVKKHIQESS